MACSTATNRPRYMVHLGSIPFIAYFSLCQWCLCKENATARSRRQCEQNGRIECHHAGEDRRAAFLHVDGGGAVDMVGDVFAADILVGTGPDVGRGNAACDIAEPVVFLPQR